MEILYTEVKISILHERCKQKYIRTVYKDIYKWDLLEIKRIPELPVTRL